MPGHPINRPAHPLLEFPVCLWRLENRVEHLSGIRPACLHPRLKDASARPMGQWDMVTSEDTWSGHKQEELCSWLLAAQGGDTVKDPTAQGSDRMLRFRNPTY